MTHTLSLEKILMVLAALAGLIYLGVQIGYGNIILPILILFVGGLAFVFFKLNYNIWLVIPVSLLNPIPLGILPVQFKAVELAFLLLVIYLVFVHLAMKHQAISLGPMAIWVPLLIITVIILYHQARAGIGLRIVGSEAAGARRHFMFFIAAVFYVALLSIWPKDWKWFRRVPGIYLITTLIATVPTIFAIHFPATAMAMGLFYFLVGFGDVMTYFGGGVQRISSWGVIGLGLQLWLISRYPLQTWFDPQRLWVPMLSVVALFLCGLSGFRSILFYYAAASGTAALITWGWRSVFLLIPPAVVVAFLTVGNGRWFELPQAAQRALSFLPGDWDPVAKADAMASTDFRRLVTEIYAEKYAALSPWIGNGYKIDAADVTPPIDPGFMPSHEVVERFVRVKDFHIGWISVYDTVGVIGFIAFLWLCLAASYLLVKGIRRVGPRRLKPVQVWVACFLTYHIAGFFTVFGNMADVMPPLLFGIGLMLVVYYQMPGDDSGTPIPAPVEKPGPG